MVGQSGEFLWIGSRPHHNQRIANRTNERRLGNHDESWRVLTCSKVIAKVMQHCLPVMRHHDKAIGTCPIQKLRIRETMNI